MSRWFPLALALLATGCSPILKMPGPPGVVGRHAPTRAPLPAPPPPEHRLAVEPAPVEPLPAPTPGIGADVASAAEHYLTHTPKGYRSDCSGFVCAAVNRVGIPLEGNTRGIWEIAKANGGVHHRKTPELGDLVFFDQTYDRNRNGRLDDELTHIAVVMDIELDGTLVLAHGGTGRGRSTLRMNLEFPDVRTDPTGRVLNGYLRARSKSDPKRTEYLAGQLWRAFATVDPAWFEDEVAQN